MYSKKTVPELKEICRSYKLKVSGNKKELIKRIIENTERNKATLIIQKFFRKYLIKKFNQIKGEHLRKLCVNDTDFYSLDDIKEISYTQFFAFKDITGHAYGWDISSIWNLIIKVKSGEKLLNPYTCTPFPEYVYSSLNKIIKLNKILKINMSFSLEVDNGYVNTFESKLLSTFQYINSLGNYSDHNWVLELSDFQLKKFVMELYDIWTYRAGLSNEMRSLITISNPFPFNVVLFSRTWYTLEELREFVLSIIYNFVYKGQNNEYKQLGVMYVLTALTMVNQNAANALPWLYLSVV